MRFLYVICIRVRWFLLFLGLSSFYALLCCCLSFAFWVSFRFLSDAQKLYQCRGWMQPPTKLQSLVEGGNFMHSSLNSSSHLCSDLALRNFSLPWKRWWWPSLRLQLSCREDNFEGLTCSKFKHFDTMGFVNAYDESLQLRTRNPCGGQWRLLSKRVVAANKFLTGQQQTHGISWGS